MSAFLFLGTHITTTTTTRGGEGAGRHADTELCGRSGSGYENEEEEIVIKTNINIQKHILIILPLFLPQLLAAIIKTIRASLL